MAKLSDYLDNNEETNLLEDLIDMSNTNEEKIKVQEQFFQPVNKWSNFKCVGCGNIFDMFKCKSHGGSMVCPTCGKLN